MATATVRIPLTRDLFAIVDEADLQLVLPHKWHAHKCHGTRTFYAYACRGVKMHRILMGCSPGDGVEIDHRNGNGLDNRRVNLRCATHAENMRNQAKTRGTSRFKGVHWDKVNGMWSAKIKLNGRARFLGRFSDEADAARIYNLHAARLFGLFARLNEVT